MSRVVLAAADEDLILRVKQAADGDVSVLPPGRLPADPARLFEQLLDGELPDVLVIGPGASPDAVLTLAARLDIQTPGISVVLMTEASQQMWQAAMRSGIRDLLPPSANVPEIRDALERASLAANGRRRVLRPVDRDRALHRPGHHHRLAQGRGRARRRSRRTWPSGSPPRRRSRRCWSTSTCSSATCASALSMVPEYTLPDVVRGPASEDTMVLKTFLTQHPSGLYAVCGAESPAAGDTVRGEDVTRLLALAGAGVPLRRRRHRAGPVRADAGGARPRHRRRDADQHGRPRRPRAAQGARRAARAVHDPGRPARGHELRRPQGRAVGARRRDHDRHRRRRRPAAVLRRAGVDQPGRAAAAERQQARPDGQGAAPAGVPVRGHPADEAGPLPGQAPGGAS